MKRIIVKCALAGAFLALGTGAQAQSSIGSKIKSAVEGITNKDSDSSEATSDDDDSSSSSSSGGILSKITSVISNAKMADEEKIIGTWVYTEPAVVFESDNALMKIGGAVAANELEKELQSVYEKIGIKEGKLTMTFDEDGNFKQKFGISLKGTYTIEDGKLDMKYGKSSQFVGTTQLDGNNLIFVMDVSGLLSLVNTIGSLSGSSLLSSLTSILDSVDGMECGFKFKKE